MPEGDTVFKVAERLRPALEGRRLVRVELHGRPAPSLHERVRGVVPVGKNLLIELDGGETILVHLGMHGSWHRYGLQEGWLRPARQASIRFDTDAWIYVCFNAMTVDFLDARAVRTLKRELELDLLNDAPFDGPAIVRRVRQLRRPDSEILDALLDQRTAAGIGNVYKSEVLFLERIHPRWRLDALGDEQIAALYRRAWELLRANLADGPRRTRTERGPRHFVYGRSGQPCPICESPICYSRLGRARRGTYWCPCCQPLPADAARSGNQRAS